MSRLYFHSPSGEAELLGSEYYHLGHIARGPAVAAWNLDETSNALQRAAEILALVPEVSDGEYGANYLHRDLRKAEAQHAVNMRIYGSFKPGSRFIGEGINHEPERCLVQSLKTRLNVNSVPIVVNGSELHSRDVELNTALAAGSDPVRLAAKISGWGSSHVWVEGPDRAWLANLIDQGLHVGLFRRGVWYVDRVCDGPASKQPDRQWSSQGWEEVQAFLRERDDEPVVTSHSVESEWPNARIAGWLPPWPEGVEERWSTLTEEQQAAYNERDEAWDELDGAEQWRLSLEGLRTHRPWARLTSESLALRTFGPPVTIYDLFAPDRDERVAAAVTDED